MEAVKKYWLWSIFISILTVFAMSYNVSAINFTYNLNNYELVKNYQAGVNYCNISGGFNISQGIDAFCSFGIQGQTTLKSITVKPNFNIKKGDLLEYYIYLIINTPNAYSPILNNIGLGDSFSTLNFELVMDDELYNEFQSQGGYINWAPNNDLYPGNYIQIRKNFYIYKVSQIALKELSAPYIGLDSSLSSTGIFQFDANALGVNVQARIRNLNIYRFVGSEENKEQEEKTQAAADASEIAGGSSSSDAQTGTTSLINAITGAVTVISSASPTNCKINGNMGNLDMGQLDLCANPAPAFVQTIGSLILILMCVPLAITLFNRFISLFRSFQS